MLENKYFEIIITLIFFVSILVVRFAYLTIINRHAKKYELENGQAIYATKFFNIALIFIVLVGLSLIWGISLKGLSIYFASIFTVVGVALFAYWSILSNITSSIILFFYSPLKIGSEIEIIDKEHGVKGKVIDITFFTINILTPEGDEVSYPNNLAIQKPIKRLK